jgi:hypothetical protein
MSDTTYTSLDDAIQACEGMQQEYEQENGPDAEDGWHDVVEAIALQCTPDVAAELRRTQLGI